jgi:23S rRNA (cytosine1962-C5)-methyltransferase
MTEQTTLAVLRLKPRADKRLRQGHCWVYSNEVDTGHHALKNFAAGQQVVVENANGKPLGLAYVNPHSLIFARLFSRETRHPLDKSLLRHRLNIALSLRERFYGEPYYRLVYGESDELPGLVVDRFGDTLVAQLNTAGMDAVKDEVVEALEACLKPKRLLFRNDSQAREVEGLTRHVEWAIGDGEQDLEILENGASFNAPATSGQKTGWFYDHRDNRQRLQSWVRDCRVLDVFSYLGAWGIEAAVAGASEVHCVDSSQEALDYVAHNAALNRVSDKVNCLRGLAFDVLESLVSEGDRYDVVILDPPAFIKRKRDMIKGSKAYKRINQLGLRLLNNDGLLVSASCSMHFERAALVESLRAASTHVDRRLRIIAQGGQAVDHPVHPAIPETEYLKAAFCRVTSAG